MSVRCNTIPTPEDASRPDRSSSTHLGLPKARESSGNNSGIDFEHTNRGVAKTSRGGRASMIFYRIGLKKTNNHVKHNAELFTLTYGAIVRQLLTDLEEVEEVNKQLDQMGYNIGIRLIDEFLANSNVTRCVDFRETAEVIAKVYSSSLESSIV